MAAPDADLSRKTPKKLAKTRLTVFVKKLFRQKVGPLVALHTTAIEDPRQAANAAKHQWVVALLN